MEAIIESVDEFYSENLAQEVTRGMREAASRGFWIPTYAPYGYRKVYVLDGAKKRPKLALNPPTDGVVRRMFGMAASGASLLDIAKILNDEGIASPNGKRWPKTSIHRVLSNEAYTGTVVWGLNAKDGAPPCVLRMRSRRSSLARNSDVWRSSCARRLLPWCIRVAPPVPTFSAGWSSARSAARPSPPTRQRAASTPTTCASPS